MVSSRIPGSQHSDAPAYDVRLAFRLESGDNERKKEPFGKVDSLNLADSQS